MIDRAARDPRRPALPYPAYTPQGGPVEPQAPQVDAVAIIDALTAEIAALTRRAVIAEQRVRDLEQQLQGSTGTKESK